MNKKEDDSIITGSHAFFSCYSGFVSKDTDEIRFVEQNPSGGFERIIKGSTKDIFYIEKASKEEYIKYFLGRGSGMTVAFFITPKVAETIGLTIEDLELIRPLRKLLATDPIHEYLGIIYDYYIENNGFYLTEKQRQLAYTNYLNARR